MTVMADNRVVESLRLAGIKLALMPERALVVTPASRLTNELRTLIQGNKDLLVDWLELDKEPPINPADWRELAAAYHAHHFKCPTCIAAGRESRYGQRCGAGMALWRAYCDYREPPY